jgi:hypothetical protein
MTQFAGTTIFQLVRRLAAAGLKSPSLYLIICADADIDSVRSDLELEVRAQLGFFPRSFSASKASSDRLENIFSQDEVRPFVLITIDHWKSGLFQSLDRNVVLLKRAGVVIFIATPTFAERALAKAPNMRNRFTDILAVKPSC